MRFHSPFLVKVAGRLAGCVVWSIFRTLRYELHTCDVNPYDSNSDERFLFSIWHDSAVMAAFGGRHRHTIALTSRHRDGTFVESILRTVNVNSVRGSSGRTGSRAALELLSQAKRNDIVITPDGPRGPRRTMSRGIVYLAAKTGNAIVPTAFACSKRWDVRGSWTSLTIPKPFARIVLLAGDPIYVPSDVADGELESWRKSVQQKMDELHDVALAELASPSGTPFQSKFAPPTHAPVAPAKVA